MAVRTFTENLFVDYQRNQAFSHVWSLCIEEQFYLLLPLLVVVVWRRRNVLRSSVLVASGIVVAGLLVRGYVLLEVLRPLGPDSDAFSLAYIERLYYPTHTRLDGLLFGVLLASVSLFRPGWWDVLRRYRVVLLVGGVAVVGGSMWLFRDRFDSDTGSAAWAIVVGLPILAAGLSMVVAAGAMWGTTVELPGVRGLALLAYSLYLTHKEVMHLVRLVLPEFTEVHRWLAMPVYAVACVTCASLLYAGVERPFLLLRERRSVARAERRALAEPTI